MMTDAEKREKVIFAIENCLTTDSVTECRKTECPFISCRESCLEWLLRSALDLLKEQEPRVMTWDELMRLANGDPAFIEARDWSCCWVLVYPTYMGLQDKNGYGVRWRYWTSRPSEQQMRETPWEGEEDHEA